MIPPKLFLLIFHFVHFSLLEIGFSTILIPTSSPIPIFLHLMTEGMSPQSFNFVWFVDTMVMLGSLWKMLRKKNDKIVPFLIDKSLDWGKISTYLMRSSFLEIVIVGSDWNKIRFSGVLDGFKMRNHVQNDLVRIDGCVRVEFIGRYHFQKIEVMLLNFGQFCFQTAAVKVEKIKKFLCTNWIKRTVHPFVAALRY